MNVSGDAQRDRRSTDWRARGLESALATVTEGLVVLDGVGRIVSMNQAAQEVFAYSPQDMSLPFASRVQTVRFEDAAGAPLPAEALPGYRALRGETVMKEVLRFIRPERAAPSWLSVNATPLQGPYGSNRGAVVAFQDITERLETESALRRTKEFLEQLIDTSHCAVFVVGPDGRFRTKNKACEKMTGYTMQETLGRHFSEFLPGEYLVEAGEIFRRVISEGRSIVDQEIPFIHKDGSVRTFFMSAAPLRDGGPAASVLCSGVDISDRKALETELVRATEQAESATRAKSEFLANMSHEIRTPMTGILGMTGLALKSCTEPKSREFLRLAMQSGESLLSIINDILDLSKIEAGKILLGKDRFNLRDLLSQVLTSFELAAKEKNLRLLHSVDLDVPDSLVGDAMRLRQILTNLLGNAIKFTKRGRVALSVKCAPGTASYPAGPDCSKLLFSVQDTGIGIPPGKTENIFESFSQAHASHPEFGGTGLGLAISKKLVSMMGGEIWVESEMDKGSKFYFTAHFELSEEEKEITQGANSPATPPHLPPLKILLAEDNPVNQLLAIALLQRDGHAVTLANNGLEALEALKREPFDVVLMDVRMPELDGEEATARIRAGEAGEDREDVPIVALTAHALVGDRERFLAAGMDDYVSKPVSDAKLTTALARCLAKRKRG
jgi:PAS domain S-box-containing protein